MTHDTEYLQDRITESLDIIRDGGARVVTMASGATYLLNADEAEEVEESMGLPERNLVLFDLTGRRLVLVAQHIASVETYSPGLNAVQVVVSAVVTRWQEVPPAVFTWAEKFLPAQPTQPQAAATGPQLIQE